MAELSGELFPSPFFDDLTAFYGNGDGGVGSGWSASAAYPGHAQGYVLTQKPAGQSNMSLYVPTLLTSSRGISVVPGQKLVVKTWVFITGPVGGFSSGIAQQVYGYNDSGAYTTNTRAGEAVTTPPIGEWFEVGGNFTVPAGVPIISPRATVYYPPTAIPTEGKYYIGRTTVFDPARTAGGVADVSASTDARLGIVSDIYSRSREKIRLKLAGVDDLVRSGHRIELAAAAMTSTPAVWHWRQVTGPTVALNARENTCDFIAPDVERSTRIRIGVYAASEDGGNRSDWHYFDLDVEPPMLRFRGGDDGDFSPRSPYLVGYSRGKREIWNDVIRPATYEKNPRHELEVVDLGVPDDDVVFSTETPKRMAAGGVWVNPETGDVFRNFGAGYNETNDTTASPRTSTYWVNPANGDILEWIED